MVILLKLKGLKRQSHKGGQSQESGGIPAVAGSTDENFCPVFSLNEHKHTDTTSFGSSCGKRYPTESESVQCDMSAYRMIPSSSFSSPFLRHSVINSIF